MYFLRLDLRGGRGRLPIDRTLVIGRSNTADIILDAPTISRLHCRLYLHEETLTIEDLGSQSGTRCNGDLITKSTPIRAGDILHVGTFAFIVEDETPQRARPAKTYTFQEPARKPAPSPKPALATLSTADDLSLAAPSPTTFPHDIEDTSQALPPPPPSPPSPSGQSLATLSTADDLSLADLGAAASSPPPLPKPGGLTSNATTIDLSPPTWHTPYEDPRDPHEATDFDEETAPQTPPPPPSWTRKEK